MSETGVLYRWPDAARFGRVVPKTKFYEHATVRGAVRQRFVDEVQRITWAYKLADETVHLRGTASVPEIQVFVVDAKDGDVSNDVLAVIDKAVKFPIIFEVTRDDGDESSTRMVAAHKGLGGPRPSNSDYFSTTWLDAQTARAPLPPAVDLAGLYSSLLATVLPLAARPGEAIHDAVDRVDRVGRLDREIAALDKRLQNEPQFNRKVELRRELRSLTAQRDALVCPNPTTTEDAQWKS